MSEPNSALIMFSLSKINGNGELVLSMDGISKTITLYHLRYLVGCGQQILKEYEEQNAKLAKG